MFWIRNLTKALLDLDSVGAIIWQRSGLRYLLQHRENRRDIVYPSWWSLFGGALEAGESPEEALRREMVEELELYVSDFKALFSCTFDLRFSGARMRKTFFSVEVNSQQIELLVLREGQGMAWLRFKEILARADRVVPYDLGALALHQSRCSPRAMNP
jgi:8-oxo-dGTP diphosphatase